MVEELFVSEFGSVVDRHGQPVDLSRLELKLETNICGAADIAKHRKRALAMAEQQGYQHFLVCPSNKSRGCVATTIIYLSRKNQGPYSNDSLLE